MNNILLIAVVGASISLGGCNEATSGASTNKEGMVSWNDPQQVAQPAKTSGLSSIAPAAQPAEGNELSDVAVKERSNGCDRMFLGGVRPAIVDEDLNAIISPEYDELCYRAFSVGHAGKLRIPVWSAEMLDRDRMVLAGRMSRDSDFEADPNLRENRKSVKDDYRRSGMDRGHLAPSADMPSMEAQAESFYLSNIVPQDRHLNGGKWAELEGNLRSTARRTRVYVVTGPIIQNARRSLRKRVLVPSALFKAFFAVDRGAVVFVASNERNARWNSYSVDQFTSIYGIDPFPAMPLAVRKHNLSLGAFPRLSEEDEKLSGKNKNGDKQGSSSGSRKRSTARLNGASGTGTWMSVEAFTSEYGRPPRDDEYMK